MNRYETNSKGTSPALSAILNKFADMPRSAFDETRRKVLDAAPFAIIPIECFQMFPNSEAFLSYDIQALTKNPTIKRMLSSMNIELRTYVCRNSDLWEGWNNFVTKGRSGKLNKSIPYIDFIHESGKHSALPYNPYHYLNISPAVTYKSNQSFNENQGIIDPTSTGYKDTGLLGSSFDISTSDAYNKGQSALPAVMYTKIAKEYQNSNLLQDNINWYPENENHDLILPYGCTHAANASYDKPTLKFGGTTTDKDGNTITANELQPTNDEKSFPWLNVLFYRQRKGNYFNTGSPFPDLLRGDIPTLDVLSGELADDTIDLVSSGSVTSLIDFANAVLTSWPTSTYPNGRIIGVGNSNGADNKKLFAGTLNSLYTQFNPTDSNNLYEALNKATIENSVTNPTYKLHDKTINSISMSMKQWRKLATMTVFRERMARTDGSYNQMIQAQFMHNPMWHEHSVKYCGGSYQPIVFSEVVQQSADASTPLGTTAGRAVSASSGNNIHVKVDDYSIFMTVLTITPDDYYSQGIQRMWSELTQAEQYFPILNNLDPQAIKNKEIFITGTDSDDEDVLNYQELFSHFKSRQNEVSGLMSLPISEVGDTGAYIFNRLFTAKPEFNNSFVTGKFTSNEDLCFASTEQAQFALSIVSRFKYVAPMPAITQPADMGLSY